jgi:hypothetical protein
MGYLVGFIILRRKRNELAGILHITAVGFMILGRKTILRVLEELRNFGTCPHTQSKNLKMPFSRLNFRIRVRF